jgi:RNA methyltransferase, TrmH family
MPAFCHASAAERERQNLLKSGNHDNDKRMTADKKRDATGSRLREPARNLRSSPQTQAQSELITSRDNRWLKEFRGALRSGTPTSEGAVGVEGVRLVEEALSSPCAVHALLFSESGEKHRERLAPFLRDRDSAFPILRTADRLFEGIADTEHPQGVAALVVPRKASLDDLLEQSASVNTAGINNAHTENPLLVALAGVQDPGNVGAIVRTAAALGATGVITAATAQSGTASPFAPKALRASAGAALHLPVVSGMALGILLTQLKLKGIQTLATSVEDSAATNAARPQAVAPWAIDWTQPIVLLVGNEGAGLPEEVVRSADSRVHVPMADLHHGGKMESLNAAAATAVLLYEAFRQRTKAKKTAK